MLIPYSSIVPVLIWLFDPEPSQEGRPYEKITEVDKKYKALSRDVDLDYAKKKLKQVGLTPSQKSRDTVQRAGKRKGGRVKKKAGGGSVRVAGARPYSQRWKTGGK